MKKLFILLLTASLCLVAEARRVSGKVACGKEALSGVIVTDGASFTTTGRNGKFKLDVADDARFVYIVSPSGYQPDFSTGAPQFYQALTEAKRYSFQLNRTRDGKDFTILAVSDPQMKHERHLKKFCKAPLPDLTAQAQAHDSLRNTVVVALGDAAWNELNMFDPYKKAIAKTGVPFYNVIGNHDFIQNIGGRAAQKTYEDFFGPTDWAFWLGGDLVVGLNNIRFRGEVDDPVLSGKKPIYPQAPFILDKWISLNRIQTAYFIVLYKIKLDLFIIYVCQFAYDRSSSLGMFYFRKSFKIVYILLGKSFRQKTQIHEIRIIIIHFRTA